MLAKKDKRRQSIAYRLGHISDMFESDRDRHYRDMLRTLQNTLSSLHAGSNMDFLEKLVDLEETRDKGLVQLKLWEQYQLDAVDSEYDAEVAVAEDDYARMVKMVQERLMSRITLQRKRLREDRAVLDIANDNMLLLSGAGTRGSYGNDMSLDDRGSSPFLSAGDFERRPVRRSRITQTNDYDDSAMSGRESGSSKRRRGGTTENDGYRSGGIPSEDNAFSDRDGGLEGLLFKGEESERPGRGQGGHGSSRHSRSYQGVTPLKTDDAKDDLNQIKAGIMGAKKIKR
ncbi:Transcriptional regulatory protein [Yarrowia sp. B02]|nr:Transcriptional regulatory protein [Yarrowia sp. B02]